MDEDRSEGGSRRVAWRMRRILCGATALACTFAATAQIMPMDRHEGLRQTSDAYGRAPVAESAAARELAAACMAVAANAAFCTCLAGKLPNGLTFEQYVVVVTRPKAENGYDDMSARQKRTYDAVPAARDACATAGAAPAPEGES